VKTRTFFTTAIGDIEFHFERTSLLFLWKPQMDVSTIMRFVYNNFHVPITVGTLSRYNPLLAQIVQFCLSLFIRRSLSQLNVSVLVHQNLYPPSILSAVSNTISVRTKKMVSNQQRRRFLLLTHSCNVHWNTTN